MIQFERFTLTNGLRVIVHEDSSTPMAVMDVMYDVGARDEDPNKTGFAHLFEHLMFGGSLHVEAYDEPLQMAGGENNAYTTNDLTNYYIQLPAENLETAFWLESDRMLSLAFSEKSLDVQRKVVCEEFKEHYINKPYGNAWHKLRELAYEVHPYRWMTIGKELSHVRVGDEIAIITYGAGVHWAEDYAADHPEISIDILDLRSLMPLDYLSIRNAVQRTGRILILHEDTLVGGIGGEIAAWVGEHCFDLLDAPVMRCASLDTPVPFSLELENDFMAKARLDETIQKLIGY